MFAPPPAASRRDNTGAVRVLVGAVCAGLDGAVAVPELATTARANRGGVGAPRDFALLESASALAVPAALPA